MTVPTFAARIAVSSVLVVPACAIGPSAPAAQSPAAQSPAAQPPRRPALRRTVHSGRSDSVDHRHRPGGTQAVLEHIATARPDAMILVVSSPWATVENYTSVVATLPGG